MTTKPTGASRPGFDIVKQLLAWNDGKLGKDEVIELFQVLIDTGMAWKLEGHIGRSANRMIERGLCTLPLSITATRKGQTMPRGAPADGVRKNNNLGRKDCRRFEDWLLSQREVIPTLTAEEICAKGTEALGIVLTVNNLSAARRAVELPAPKKAFKPGGRYSEGGVAKTRRGRLLKALARQVVTLSASLDAPLDPELVELMGLVNDSAPRPEKW